MKPTHRLDRAQAQLLVVDMQQRMLPHIHQRDAITAATLKMIAAARAMEMPTVVTEQYPAGLGPTEPRVLEAVSAPPQISKTTFSVCGDPVGRQVLGATNRPQVLLVGVETHVCVQQTALDLLEMQMQPVLLADAVSSRRPSDRMIAVERMRDAGVVVTTVESAIFELIHEAGTELFKRILPIVK